MDFREISLSTSVPIKESLVALDSILIIDSDFEHRCPLNPPDIIAGVGLCFISNFLKLIHAMYWQTDG